jgi:hypothetical protein
MIRVCISALGYFFSVVEPHHFDADPDPDPNFQIKPQTLKKVLK